jgi:hypothetical protein
MSTQQHTISEKTNSKPTHTVRKKVWSGKRTDYELIGVAWLRDDGGLYIKLYGTQVLDHGFYAFPNKDEPAAPQDGQ